MVKTDISCEILVPYKEGELNCFSFWLVKVNSHMFVSLVFIAHLFTVWHMHFTLGSYKAHKVSTYGKLNNDNTDVM